MNTALVMQGISIVNQLRSALQSNKQDKKTTVYDELRKSSASIPDLRSYLEELDKNDAQRLPEKDARKRQEARTTAGPVTQAAHVRLENRKARLAQRKAAEDALDFSKLTDQLSESADDTVKAMRTRLKPWKKKVKKQSKKVEQAAAKARKRAEKKVQKRTQRQQRLKNANKTGRNVGILVAILAALAAIGAAVYYFIFGGPGRKPETSPAATPPRVEEHSGEREANLVYSTSTEDAATEEPAGEKLAGELAEDPAERDEELLGSLDEQLAAHRREEEAVAEASTSIDDATERLRFQTEQAQQEFRKSMNQDVNDDSKDTDSEK